MNPEFLVFTSNYYKLLYNTGAIHTECKNGHERDPAAANGDGDDSEIIIIKSITCLCNANYYIS